MTFATFSGPCVGCGLTNYPLSMGGPTICPACDAGQFGPQQIKAQRDEIERLRIEIAAICIYNAFPYDGPEGTTKPAWVPFGNSMKQDEARSLARKEASHDGPSREVKI